MLTNFTRLFYSYRCLFLVFLLLQAFAVQAQTTIARWNFNSTFTIPANGNAPAPSTGSGIIILTGGVTGTNAAGVNADPGTPNNGLNTTAYPAQGTSPKTAGISITVATTGYNNIHLKFYTRNSGSAAKKIVVQYYNGATWQDAFTYLATNMNFSTEQNVDLSGFAVLNNTASAQLRLVTDYSNGSNYEGPTTTYGSTGTIRYDLVTVTGNTLTCVGPATQQASGLRLLKTDASSAQLTLNRGNGGGCLVLCSNSGIPSPPANNTVYVANAAFGNGTALGNGFAVYNTQVSNPAIQYFNITNLAAGRIYYVAAYEYSNAGNCYLAPAFVDSFYCNSTVLYPGDVQFVGYDNSEAAGGRDFFVMTNLAPLKKGTTFQIINSRYEAGAAADERTNRWYAGGNDIHQNLQRITVTYTGDSLAEGSIISFSHLPQNPANMSINGNASSNLTITDNLTIGNLLSGTGAEQVYITQGRFTSYGSATANNQYSVLNGHVLHGFSYNEAWVDFAQPCDSTTTIRHSRVPPDITGIRLFFSTGGFAYYKPDSLHVDTQGNLVQSINNAPKWTIGGGTTGNDIISAVLNRTFSPNRMNAAGTWTGNANDNNWFNSLNWEGLFVPDSLTDVNIPAGRAPQINANATFANLYNRTATTRALTIAGGPIVLATVTLSGTGAIADKLIVYDSLLVDTTGRFSAIGGNDTIVVRGNLQRRDGADIGAFTNSFISLEGNRELKPIYVWLVTGTLYNIRALSINNLPGVVLLNGGVEAVQELRLTNGVLAVTRNFSIFFMGQGCGIISPVNQFGEINRGWEKSFVDGRIDMRTTNVSQVLTAPVGSASRNVFAPMVFETNTDANANNRNYSASYMAASHPNVLLADISTPPLDHVSELEYWTLNSPNPAAAKVTLYYTPYSRVSGVGNTAQALQDLRVAQYWDSISSGSGTPLWRFPGAGSHTVTGDSNYGKIAYNDFATDLSFSSQNFTLGTISSLNILPIQLLAWKATPQPKQVRLTWKVADETDVNFYTIEKSTDGVHYTSLQRINKATNSYTLYDTKPADGWNYYRLKATGIDGKIFYSDIQKVWYAVAGQWLVYPNPATDMLWLQLPAVGTVTLYTLDGKIIMQRKLPASLNKLPVQSFEKGLYLLEYFDGRKRQSQRISLQ